MIAETPFMSTWQTLTSEFFDQDSTSSTGRGNNSSVVQLSNGVDALTI